MIKTNKAVFLDRDGVLNEEIGDYVWEPAKFVVCPGVPESLARLKAAGYLLIVVTNQAGIAKQLYTATDVHACHAKLQAACHDAIDAFYFADSHPSVSESILRKPDSGMLEKAVAHFGLAVDQCWIVGDRLRDMAAGAKVGVRGILVGPGEETPYAPHVADLRAATDIILAASPPGPLSEERGSQLH
jgi:D-glycero-D-manno-heptose 1,7-bisphosphate phosphatase